MNLWIICLTAGSLVDEAGDCRPKPIILLV